MPFDNWLIYATGGLALGSTELSFSTVPTAAACSTVLTCTNGSITRTKVGWTIGGGVEYGLNAKWTVRAEYLYVDLGSQSLTLASTAPGFGFTASTRYQENIVRGAVNYWF